MQSIKEAGAGVVMKPCSEIGEYGYCALVPHVLGRQAVVAGPSASGDEAVVSFLHEFAHQELAHSEISNRAIIVRDEMDAWQLAFSWVRECDEVSQEMYDCALWALLEYRAWMLWWTGGKEFGISREFIELQLLKWAIG